MLILHMLSVHLNHSISNLDIFLSKPNKNTIRIIIVTSKKEPIPHLKREPILLTIVCKCTQISSSFFVNYFLLESGVTKEQLEEAEKKGYLKVVIKEGDGKTIPKKGQKVMMHYTGRLTNGKVFDSSVARKQAFSFQLGIGQVIRGWFAAFFANFH